MSNGDWLKSSYDEGRKGSDLVKTALLVNRTFTIHKLEVVERRDESWAYVGVLQMDGEQETIKAWLDGVGVKEQLADMDRNRRLPCRVTMSQDGQAYELTWPQGSATTSPPPPDAAMTGRPAAATPPQSASSRAEQPVSGPWQARPGDSPTQQLGSWLTHYRWTARDAMVALGVNFNEQQAKQEWQQYIGRVATAQGTDEQGAYAQVLSELVAYMERLAAPTPAEEIPFGGDGPEAPAEEIPFE